MSMWSVPDKETRERMIQFYRNILSGKMNRCQALRQAALREMQILKERYGYADPFYWVPLSSWASLDIDAPEE